MKYSKGIKPISYLKSHASELIRNIAEQHETMIITQNGVAKVIVQDIHVYEEIQESLAMLKLLAQSKLSLQQGKFEPADEAFADIAKQIKLENN